MEARYPFDPYDWSTIMPLYQALIAAPHNSRPFGEWLAAWNTLEVAVQDAWTRLKLPAYYDTRDVAAERAYQSFTEQMFSTHLELSNALIERALAQQPTPSSPLLEQLWRRWRNQATLFSAAGLPLQAEISRLEGSYRELMRNYRADAVAPLAYWLERRDELNGLMLRLLEARRQLARVSGAASFLEFRWRELNRLDYTIADCEVFHRAVEMLVVPALAQLRAGAAAEHAPPELAPEALAAAIQRMLNRLDRRAGDLFRRMRDGYLDLGSRPGKAPAVEEWFFPGAGLPYLHVASSEPASVLHELGHGLHDYLSFRTQGWLWNTGGPDEFQEFAAIGLEQLCHPLYERAQGGPYSAPQSAVARRKVLRFYLEAMAGGVLEDAFEHWVYGQAPPNILPEQLDAKWLELKQRFTPWDAELANAAVAQSGWQRWTWSLFRMPLYMITYPAAIVATCRLGMLAQADRRAALDGYIGALELGNTRPLPELFAAAGVELPFGEQAVRQAVDFVLERV